MKNFKAKLLGVSLIVLTLSACNKSFDKVVPPSPSEPATPVFKRPKVLYIIADGARGTQVRDADVPTLKSLLPNAIYTWTSLADPTATNATNWSDMITGVKKEKHNVLTEDFAGNNLSTYKTIFERIKSIKPNTRIVSYSTSPKFKEFLTAGVTESVSATGDEDLKTKLVAAIKTDTADLVVAEFSDIQKAGIAGGTGGFDNTNPGYKNAIKAFDTQVGAIITSLKSRTTYAAENWMIVVTSNMGGAFTLAQKDDDKTIFSNTSVNTFTIIYSAGYTTPTFIAKPFVGSSYTGNAVNFFGNPKRGSAKVSELNSPFFNFGDTSGFTISVKVKKHKNPYNISRGDYYYQWPSILGKRGTSPTNNTPASGWGGDGFSRGWDFSLFQNRWRFMITGNTSGATGLNEEIAGAEFSGDTWHDLTAVVERRVDGVKQVRLYTDGIQGITNKNSGSNAVPSTNPFVLGGAPNFDNNSVLRMGWVPGQMDGSDNTYTFGAIDVELKELKIFKIAIPATTIAQYACDQTIDRSHPYYNYLIGYWPINEGSGTTVKDIIGAPAANMEMTQAQGSTTALPREGFAWTAFTDLLCSPAASDLGLKVPKNSDIPAQILSWFNIARQTSWSLDGKVWIAN